MCLRVKQDPEVQIKMFNLSRLRTKISDQKNNFYCKGFPIIKKKKQQTQLLELQEKDCKSPGKTRMMTREKL